MKIQMCLSNSKDLFNLVIHNETSLTNLDIGLILKTISEDFLNENKSDWNKRLDAFGKNNGGIDDTGAVGRPQLPEVLESELYQLTSDHVPTKAD